MVTEGHTQSFVVVFMLADGCKFQHRTGDDSDDNPYDDADQLGVERLHVGTSEERPNEGHASVHTDGHDEEDAHVKVEGKEKPLHLTCSIPKHPAFLQGIVNNQERQR